MADDRPAPAAVAVPAEWEEQPDMSLEEDDAWFAENLERVRAKVQEALDDPRPALTSKEIRASLEAHARELFAKYGR